MKYYIRDIMPDPVNRRVLLAMFSVIAIYGLTVGFLYPLISIRMENWGYSSAWIGFMGTLPFLASVFVAPLIPVIIRTANVSKLVFLSICADIFFLAVMAFIENIYVWFVCRFFTGVAGTVLFVVSETWINEIAEDRTRGRVIGLYTLTFSTTLAISPLFIVFVGVDGKLPFLFAVTVIAIGLYPLRWTRDSKPDFSGGKVSHVLQFVILAPTLVCAAAVMAFEEAAIMTLLPVYAIRSGLTAEVAAVFLTVLAVGSMVAQPILGVLADKMNRYKLILICALIVLIGAVLLPVVIDSEIIVWPIMLVWGGAIAGIYTVALVIMGQRFRGAQLAAGNAAFGLMWGVAGALAPASAGIAMSVWDPHGFVVVATAMAIIFLIVYGLRRHFRGDFK